MKKSRLLSMALLLPTMVMAQWSDTYNNTAVTIPDSWTIFSEEIVVNPETGTSFYHFMEPASSGMVTRLQIVDKDGCNLFDKEGMLISDKPRPISLTHRQTTLLDNDGNLLMAVCDSRNQKDDDATMSFSIYKLSPEGEMLWGVDGVDLDKGSSSELKALMNMIELEDGSYVFAWQESMGYTADGVDLYGIAMMRLSKDGDFLWDETVKLSSTTGDYKFPYLINAGSNQFILTYTEGTALNIMAQKYEFDGTTAWAEPTEVYGGGFPANALIHLIVDVKPMPNGGALFAWYDDRFYDDRTSVYVAYLDGNGKHQFVDESNGLKVAYSQGLSGMDQDLFYCEEEKCIYVVWREVNYSAQDNERLVMQKIGLNGELIWDVEGKDAVAYGEQNFSNLHLKDAGDGNFAIFFTESMYYSDVHPYAIKFNSDGDAAWAEPKFAISTYTSSKDNLLVSDIVEDSYWIAAWQDMRDEATQKSIYIQKVEVDAPESGITETTVKAPEFTATTSADMATFALQLDRASNIELALYNIAGEQVATLYSGKMAAGAQTISYPTAQLASGIYIATLRSHTTSSVKLVVE